MDDLFFYHGGLADDFDMNLLDPFKLSSKQQIDGKDYAGFYMTEHPDVANYFAQQNGGALHQLRVNGDAVIKDYPNSIERVEQGTLKRLANEGVDIIRGRNRLRNNEFILLNPKVINGNRVLDPNLFGNKVSGPMGHIVSKPLSAEILRMIEKGLRR